VKGLFVDTAGSVGWADAGDPAHRETLDARDRWLAESGILVTSDYVVDETLTILRRRLGLDAAEAWWRQVDGSSRLRWEFITLTRADRARAMFFRHRDDEYSFTDRGA
jgi:predicted nucleic acid-binding protein